MLSRFASLISGRTFATWDTAKQGANWVLSGGNLNAVSGSTGAIGLVANQAKSTGKWYFEIAINAVPSANLRLGVAASSYDWTSTSTAISSVGQETTSGSGSVSYRPNTGVAALGNVTQFTGATMTSADVLGIAFDTSTGSVEFFKNNVSQGAISVSFASFSPAISATSGQVNDVTANFGATALTYTPPSGYNAGLYT